METRCIVRNCIRCLLGKCSPKLSDVGMNKYSELGDNDANRYAKKEAPDPAEVRRQRRAAKSACQAAAEAAKTQACVPIGLTPLTRHSARGLTCR